MKEPIKEIKIGVWKRYETYDFEIAPSLAGASHQFQHKNYNIRIELPPKPLLKDWHNLSSGISCWGYRTRKNRKYPISYEIHSINMRVDTNLSHKIQEKKLERVNTSLFSKTERESLDKIVKKYENIADSAFENWINILRWKSGVHDLCQVKQNRQKSKRGTYLFEISTNKRFYTPGHWTLVERQEIITKRAWSSAQKALLDNDDVPIWHLYIAEAYQKLNLNDIRGFIIDLAIAIETIVRRVVRNFIASNATSTFEKMVDMIQIGRLVGDWKKLGFKSSKWQALNNEKATVKQVIELRNAVMHLAQNPSIDRKRAMEMMGAVLKFIKQCEQEIKTIN
jgi:hypothetical protein